MRKNLEGSYFQTLKVWAIREIHFVSFPNHQDAEPSLPAKASFSTPELQLLRIFSEKNGYHRSTTH